jgi:hypothetical protein
MRLSLHILNTFRCVISSKTNTCDMRKHQNIHAALRQSDHAWCSYSGCLPWQRRGQGFRRKGPSPGKNALVNLRPHPPQSPPLTHHREPLVISTSDAVMMLYYTKVLVLQLYQIILWNTGTPQPDVIEKDLFRIYSPHRQVGPVTSLLPHPQFVCSSPQQMKH